MHRILACLALAVATLVAAPAPASATVGNTITYTLYNNANGLTYGVFARANAGTAHAKFRVWANCTDNITHTGPWQTQPGPWYGSMATCGGGSHALGGSIGFK